MWHLVTCPSMIIQEFYSNMHKFNYLVPHFITRVRGTCIVVTPDIIFEVLHVSRVAYPDYLGWDRLKTMSKDELYSLFYETPSSWGDRQNTPCLGFTKGPMFLNMVILRGLPLIFPSQFILSLIDVYRDMVTRDKLIFSFDYHANSLPFFCLLSQVSTLFGYVCHKHYYY